MHASRSAMGEIRVNAPAESDAPDPGTNGSQDDSANAVAEDDLAQERALVAALKAGDEAAYAEVVQRYGGRLLAVARRFLRNEEDAREAVQEAALSAFRAIQGFNEKSRLKTWLHRIVVNACLMRLRTQRRKPLQSIEDALPNFLPKGHFAMTPSPWPTGEEQLETEENRALVRQAIAELPDTHREVLLLRDIEGLDTATTAQILGTTPEAIKTRLHRARSALRTAVDRHLKGEP